MNSSQNVPEEETMIYWGEAIDTLQPLFAIILIVYVYIIYVLMRTKNDMFKSPYFIVFIVTGLSDVMLGIALEYIRFQDRVGFGPEYGIFLQITTAISGTNFAIHCSGNILMALYQFTGVWHPDFHRKLWSKRSAKWMMLGVMIFSYGGWGYLFTTSWDYVIIDNKWHRTQRFSDIGFIRIMDGVMMVADTVLCAVLGGLTLYGIRTKATEEVRKNVPDASLIMVNLLNMAMGILEFLYEIFLLLKIHDSENFLVHFVLNQFLGYFFILVTVNGWALPLMSRAMRREIFYRWSKPAPDRIQVILKNHQSQRGSRSASPKPFDHTMTTTL